MKLRPVSKEDCWLLFNWANDLETRLQSFQNQPITEEEHEEWLHKHLSDPSVWGLILEDKNIPVAVVWYRRKDTVAEVDVTVAPEQRGKGYGGSILSLSAPMVLGRLAINSLRALVFFDNWTSLRAFGSAGYVQVGKECIVLEKRL